jgi:hypothetical protein
MEQYEPCIVAIYQPHNDLAGAVEALEKLRAILHTKVASDSEADRIPKKTAGPDHGNEGAKIKGAPELEA